MAERVWQKVRFSRLFHVEHNHGASAVCDWLPGEQIQLLRMAIFVSRETGGGVAEKAGPPRIFKELSPIVVRPTIRSFSFLPEGIAEATAEWRSVHPTPNREIFEPHPDRGP